MIDPEKNLKLIVGPKHVMQWGSFIILTLIIISIVLSFSIKYPETLAINLLIVSSEQTLNKNSEALSVLVIKNKQAKRGSDSLQININKISIGQNIYIKAGNFEQDGLIKGKIKSIGNIKNDTLLIEIKLDDGLITTYHKKIKHTLNMQGSGEIIFKDQSIINKWLSSLK